MMSLKMTSIDVTLELFLASPVSLHKRMSLPADDKKNTNIAKSYSRLTATIYTII